MTKIKNSNHAVAALAALVAHRLAQLCPIAQTPRPDQWDAVPATYNALRPDALDVTLTIPLWRGFTAVLRDRNSFVFGSAELHEIAGTAEQFAQAAIKAIEARVELKKTASAVRVEARKLCSLPGGPLKLLDVRLAPFDVAANEEFAFTVECEGLDDVLRPTRLAYVTDGADYLAEMVLADFETQVARAAARDQLRSLGANAIIDAVTVAALAHFDIDLVQALSTPIVAPGLQRLPVAAVEGEKRPDEMFLQWKDGWVSSSFTLPGGARWHAGKLHLKGAAHDVSGLAGKSVREIVDDPIFEAMKISAAARFRETISISVLERISFVDTDTGEMREAA